MSAKLCDNGCGGCVAGTHRNCTMPCICKPPADTSLTFAEAMALDPSEVEWTNDSLESRAWSSLALFGHLQLEYLKRCKFRRSRPKRSRVEEMATAKEGAFDVHAKERAEHYAEAIRAVVKMWRYQAGGPFTAEQIANATQLEFLEPR